MNWAWNCTPSWPVQASRARWKTRFCPYGVDKLFVFDAPELFPYTSAPHTDILVNLFKEEQPQICLMGATVIGRDLGPRVSSSLTSGLTADCTELEIGDFEDKKRARSTRTCSIRFVPPSVVTSWLPSSTPSIVRRWLPSAAA